MRSIGNTLSNQKYNPSNKSPPTTAFSGGDTSEDIELERFIRDKYERKTLLKARKLPPLPSSPTLSFHARDSDKISGQRSPSLGSSSSTNLKIGQRVSGESFEGARSPASTNSSLELPPSKPSRPSNSTGNPFVGEPLRWTGLEKNVPSLPNPSPTSAVPASKEVIFSQSSLEMQGKNISSMNPFQTSFDFTPQPQPQPPSLQPVPQMTSFHSQAQQNPFDDLNKQTVFNPSRTTSMPPQQGAQPVWNTGSLHQSTSNGGQMTPSIQPTVFSPPSQEASTFLAVFWNVKSNSPKSIFHAKDDFRSSINVANEPVLPFTAYKRSVHPCISTSISTIISISSIPTISSTTATIPAIASTTNTIPTTAALPTNLYFQSNKL